MNKLISIAMAAYNGQKFIREQIESILAQTYGSFELIIVDDCSGDGTFQIAEEYAKKDSRIRVCRNTENLGFIRNFEKAISLRTEYIALPMPEDVVYHDRLPDLAAAVNNGIVYSDKVILEYRQQQTNVTTNEKMTFFRKLRNFLNVTGTMASYRYSVTLCEELLKKEMRP